MPSAEFEDAAKRVNNLAKLPSNDELLQVYALYKQATVGPFTDDAKKPGTFDLKGKAKYNAWKDLNSEVDSEGNPKKVPTPEEAEKQYITLVEELEGKYGKKE